MNRKKQSAWSQCWVVAAVTLALFLLPQPLLAQSTGSISGTVTDETGGVLPGVSVDATNVGTGITRTVLTNDSGHYHLPGLSLGTYEVRAALSGFQTAVSTGLPVEIGRELVVNLELRVGEITEEVVVEGGATLVETRKGAISGIVDTEQIQDLPLNGRSFADLSVLEAGVSSFQNAISSDPTATAFGGTGVRLVFNGMRPELNNILIDGIDAIDAFGNAPGSAAGVLLGVDTVREFETVTSTYSAEFGRAAGGVINVATRSGTNQFRGSVFEYHRNDNLDASNFFDAPINDAQGSFLDKDKPEFKRNQFGFTAGGPIVPDQTFIFGSYEGFREGLGLTSIATVPTEDARDGRFPDGTVVSVNPDVEPFLDLYPQPNGRDFGDGRAEFLFGTNSDTDEDFFLVKADHQLNDQHSFFARYSFDDAEKKFPALGSLFGPSLVEPFLTRDSSQHLLSVQESWILSSGALNVARFGYNRTFQEEAQFPGGVFPELTMFEGLSDGMGLIRVVGLSTIGGWNLPPGRTLQNMFQAGDDFSWISGDHSLKVGGVFKRFHYDDDRFFQGGAFNFDCLTGCSAGPPGRTEFLAGFPVSVVIDAPGTDYNTEQRFNVWGVYIQDDWRARPGLTVNLGLRYEAMSDPSNKLGPVLNFSDPLRDAEASVVSDKPFQVSKNNFMPRMGLAWDPFGDQKTAIRAGFGVFFQQLNEANFNFVFRLSQPPTKTVLIGGPPAAGAFPKVTIPDPFVPVIIFPLEHQAKSPYTMQWNLTMERELFPEAVASVAYVGNRGVHLGTPTEINFKKRQCVSNGVPVVLPAGEFSCPVGQQAFFPPGPPNTVNSNFRSINLRDFGSDSSYHGFQARFRKRYSQGFQAQISYTVSKTIDNSPPALRDFENSPTILLDWYQRHLDRSLSGFDVRNNFVLNFGYELPFGPGKALASGSTGAASRLLEGWQINGIISLADGNPFTVENSFDRTRTAAIGPFRHDRPNLRPGADSSANTGSPDAFFEAGNFELQEAGFFGNLGRNTVIGPGLANVDLSIFKTSQLSESADLQFRAEFFNVFNRANFATPSRDNRDVFLGVNPDGTGRVSGSAGRITGTVISSRQIQLALKLLF